MREQFISSVKDALAKSGDTPITAANKLGLKRDAIRSVMRGASPSIDKAAEIAQALGLEFYIGPHRDKKNLILARENQENTYAVPTVAAPFDPEVHKSEHVLVPKLAVRASAGHGAINDHERPEHLLAFRRDWFRKHGLRLDRLGAIEVNGDSMEPTLLDGETILINCGCAMPPPLQTLVVARVNDEELLVKRLYKWDDGYVLLSDNNIYQPIKLTSRDEIIGEVVWRGVWIQKKRKL